MVGLAGSAPQLLHAFYRGAVIESLVLDEPGSYHGAGTALAAPAVDVDDVSGVELPSDVFEDVVVARVVDDVGVGNFEAMAARPRLIRPLR